MASASISPVRIPSWADALEEETVTAFGVQPAEAHDAPSDMPEGGSTDVKPPVALPPYTAEDNPERGIQCYVKGCRAPVMHNWKTVFEHVRRFHNVKQSRMKHTFLYQASREEINKEDRRRDKQKHGIPLSDEVTMTVATKRMKEKPEPSVKGPLADEVAGTSSDNPHMVWEPPAEFVEEGFDVIAADHHSLRLQGDGQVHTEPDGVAQMRHGRRPSGEPILCARTNTPGNGVDTTSSQQASEAARGNSHAKGWITCDVAEGCEPRNQQHKPFATFR